MGHPNAPFTPEGRRRLVERIDAGVPISHVASEANVSRQSLTVWYKRWIKEGEAGLEDRSSRPHHSPNLLPDVLGDRIEELRREHKWGPDRISGFIAINDGHDISPEMARYADGCCGGFKRLLRLQSTVLRVRAGHPMMPGMQRPQPDLAVCGTCGGSGWDDSRRGLLCGWCRGVGWVIVTRPYLAPPDTDDQEARP